METVSGHCLASVHKEGGGDVADAWIDKLTGVKVKIMNGDCFIACLFGSDPPSE